MDEGEGSVISGSVAPSLAPSILARSAHFDPWARGAGLLWFDVPAQPEASEFDALTTFILPNYFTIERPVSQNGEAEFYAALREWSHNNENLVSDRDPLKLEQVSDLLCFAYGIIFDAVNERACESAQRRGVDYIIQLAFCKRLGVSHRVRFEQEIQMCFSTWKERRVGIKAIADTLVDTLIPGEKMRDILSSLWTIVPREDFRELERRLYWSTHIKANSFILFLAEFKKDPDDLHQNQLLLDFCTAQYQRYALGLPDAVIWGVTCTMSQFSVYSSTWNRDHTAIWCSPHHTWNLSHPIDFLRCYAFLCMLSDKLKEDALVDISALNAAAIAQSIGNIAWCAPPPALEEMDVCNKGRETKKMALLPKEGCGGAVYDQLHCLPSDTGWWRSYWS